MSQPGLEAERVTGAKRGKSRVSLVSFSFILFLFERLVCLITLARACSNQLNLKWRVYFLEEQLIAQYLC